MKQNDTSTFQTDRERALMHLHEEVHCGINYSLGWIDRNKTVRIFNNHLAFGGER